MIEQHDQPLQVCPILFPYTTAVFLRPVFVSIIRMAMQVRQLMCEDQFRVRAPLPQMLKNSGPVSSICTNLDVAYFDAQESGLLLTRR